MLEFCNTVQFLILDNVNYSIIYHYVIRTYKITFLIHHAATIQTDSIEWKEHTEKYALKAKALQGSRALWIWRFCGIATGFLRVWNGFIEIEIQFPHQLCVLQCNVIAAPCTDVMSNVLFDVRLYTFRGFRYTRFPMCAEWPCVRPSHSSVEW